VSEDSDPTGGDSTDSEPTDSDPIVRLTAWAYGKVQGVGFRYWVRTTAIRLELRGSATNLADGSVRVVAEGPESGCRKLLAALDSGGTPGRVTKVSHRWSDAQGGLSGFVER
jgi:acylphosphatase